MSRFARSSTWLAIAMVLALVAGALVGCSSPQERYRVLSYFFDGVPDPDAPRQQAAADAEEQAANSSVVTASIVTVHKPYQDKQCNACHRAANGDIQEFEKAYDACIKCHKQVPTGRTLMHGPVAQQACRFCHAPHESNQPALLKDTPVKVCTQCHDRVLLGSFPQQHVDGVTSCLECHYGHGGDARPFLKPPSPPKAAPASMPATQPGMQPATQPAEAAQCPAPTLVLAAGPAGEGLARVGKGSRHDPIAAAAQERGP